MKIYFLKAPIGVYTLVNTSGQEGTNIGRNVMGMR